MATNTAVNISEKKQDLSHWVPSYTSAIILMGCAILVSAVANRPQDLWGLFLFASLAAVSELSNVELFRSSHANVSVSMIIAIASIAVFGPYGAVFVQLVGGMATGFKVLVGQKKEQPGKRASWLRLSSFNVGMFLIAAFVAGWVYVFAGGVVGQIEFYSDLLPLFLAASAYVIVNMVLLIAVIILQTGRSLAEIWDQDFSWGVPIHILGGVLGGGALAFAYESFSILGLLVFFLPVLMTSYSFRLYINNMRSVVDRLEEVNRDLDEANIGLLHTLGAVIDAYDIYTYGHSTQVAIYAKAIGEKLGRPKGELDLLLKAGLIHDLGKIGITETIISKQGPLTDEEYNIVKRHTLIGADIVGQMKGLHELVPLVKHHHERWDGEGYPDGLSGEAIPLGARILALADSLDTMFSDRPYRQIMNYNEVLEEVRHCSGNNFDPQVVAAFMALAQERGDEFFKNSATTVDKFIDEKGKENFSHRLRYMKKSMISDR
jgi:putative nucleotidyltransferase with HDIG domain